MGRRVGDGRRGCSFLCTKKLFSRMKDEILLIRESSSFSHSKISSGGVFTSLPFAFPSELELFSLVALDAEGTPERGYYP